MRSEKEIHERVEYLNSMQDPEADAYLDEGEQAELYTLLWVLEEAEY